MDYHEWMQLFDTTSTRTYEDRAVYAQRLLAWECERRGLLERAKELLMDAAIREAVLDDEAVDRHKAV